MSGSQSVRKYSEPLEKVRALAMTEKSGGALPPLAAAAAWSFGKGGGIVSAGRAGRSNISPESFGPSFTWYVAASALTCAAEKSGPPSCARLRNATSFIEWQAEQTSL